jgi:hypothetical protein
MTEEHLALDLVDRSAILATSERQAELAYLEEIAEGACAELVAFVDGASGAARKGTFALLEVDRIAKVSAVEEDDEPSRDWSPLEDAASVAIAALVAEAEQIESGVGHTVSKRTVRQKTADAAGGASIRKKIEEIRLALASLVAAAAALTDATEEHRSFDSTGENGGGITKAFAAALKACGISRSAYWKNTLVGTHCLRLLEKLEDIFSAMEAAMRKIPIPPGVGSESLEAERKKAIKEYVGTFKRPLEELARFVPLTLKASMLTPAEIATIKEGAARYGALMREHFPASFSPKVELIVNHLGEQVEKWGTIGWFSAQGPECAHRRFEDARRMCQQMNNPKARMKATLRHYGVMQRGRPVEAAGSRKQRRSSALVVADSLAAAARTTAVNVPPLPPPPLLLLPPLLPPPPLPPPGLPPLLLLPGLPLVVLPPPGSKRTRNGTAGSGKK